MAYLCHAEQRGRMTAAAITSDILCKNECPIQGHTFLPNNKNGIMLFHIMMMSMKTAWKWESVNLSSMEKRKVSTFLANEEKKRLLKSGKDNLKAFLKYVTVFKIKRGHLILKDGHLFKKDGGPYVMNNNLYKNPIMVIKM
jgi:hypothetical protein